MGGALQSSSAGERMSMGAMGGARVFEGVDVHVALIAFF